MFVDMIERRVRISWLDLFVKYVPYTVARETRNIWLEDQASKNNTSWTEKLSFPQYKTFEKWINDTNQNLNMSCLTSIDFLPKMNA